MKMTLLKNHQKMKSMLIAVVLLFVTVASGYAQDAPGDGEAAVPIDGGLSLLLAAGAIYGGRRLARKDNVTK